MRGKPSALPGARAWARGPQLLQPMCDEGRVGKSQAQLPCLNTEVAAQPAGRPCLLHPRPSSPLHHPLHHHPQRPLTDTLGLSGSGRSSGGVFSLTGSPISCDRAMGTVIQSSRCARCAAPPCWSPSASSASPSSSCCHAPSSPPLLPPPPLSLSLPAPPPPPPPRPRRPLPRRGEPPSDSELEGLASRRRFLEACFFSCSPSRQASVSPGGCWPPGSCWWSWQQPAGWVPPHCGGLLGHPRPPRPSLPSVSVPSSHYGHPSPHLFAVLPLLLVLAAPLLPHQALRVLPAH